MITMKANAIYRISFLNAGKVYEIYARGVAQAQLYGFVEVSEIVFGEKSSVVVDPAEEKLKAEFGGVQRTLIPMHAIVRIDEVERQGTSRIRSVGDKDNVAPFPRGFLPHGGTPSE